MTDDETSTQSSNRQRSTRLFRRSFIGAGAVAGTALLAGCTTETLTSGPGDDDAEPDESAGGDDHTGRFRLLVSDQPVAIDDFDSLNVTLDSARIFGKTHEAEEENTPTPEATPLPTPTPDEPTPSPTPTSDEPTPTPTPDEEDNPDEASSSTTDEAEDDGRQDGFFTLDLEDATVDLTEVIGDKAIEVFDGELPAGQYTKIELYPSDVVGIVDGEEVTVHVPSDKLQIVMPFEVTAGETVSFVFDINVVRRGQSGEYNLTPVIAKSGVVGRDLDDIEEIDPDEDGDDVANEDGDEADADGEEGENGADEADGTDDADDGDDT